MPLLLTLGMIDPPHLIDEEFVHEGFSSSVAVLMIRSCASVVC